MTETLTGAMIHPARGDEVALYRLLDGAGELLYVGVSKHPFNRWHAFEHYSWWGDVASYTVEWHPSREAAREAEKVFLRADAATSNIHGTPWQGENQREHYAAAGPRPRRKAAAPQ